jgi:predicted nucleotidyltransferase
MVLDATAVLDRLKEHSSELQRLGVRRLALFGSVARGEAGDASDLDFVVDFERLDFDSYMDLKFLLEDLFSRPVDLLTIGGIKPSIRERVLSESIDVPGL